jgi:hypothetical protein
MQDKVLPQSLQFRRNMDYTQLAHLAMLDSFARRRRNTLRNKVLPQ